MMIEKLRKNEELWDLFTKREEYNPPLLDQYRRFPYYMSQNRTIFEPKISKFLVENGLKIEYLDGKKFALCLSHDIDVVYPYTSISGMLYRGALALKNRKFKKTLKIPFCNIKKWNPWWNFDEIMALEEKYDAKSSFYLLALNKDNSDFSYDLEDLKNEIGFIRDQGWEVGLHGSHEASNNLEKIRKEKHNLEKNLGERVVGYRNHFMRFKIPDTWELLSEVGFEYDTTFGYADCVGFRNGMCHPFKPFNLNRNREIDIWEIPLAIMDCTLFDYMRLNSESAWSIIKKLIDSVEKYNGVLTILWHNTYMIGDMLRFYENILKYCYNKGAWMSSGRDIWREWGRNKV